MSVQDRHECKMKQSDYPALYRAADAASISAQKFYTLILSLYLFLLVGAASFSLFSRESQYFAVTAAALFLSTLFLSILIAAKRYDKIWFSARAVAESVKTRTWRYIMRTEPYNHSPDSQEDTRAFLKDLKQILDQNREIADQFAQESSTGDQITNEMVSIRSAQLSSRIDTYRFRRIDDQRDWYTRKAGFNKRMTRFWFFLICSFQGLAVICALVRTARPYLDYLPTEVLAVAAASVLSWMHAKRYQELATSYSLTSQEIGFIKSLMKDVHDEKAFSDFVSDAENAFSREHTHWQARRNV
jgi:hypothetical protein